MKINLICVICVLISNLAFSLDKDTIPCIDKVYVKNLKTVRINKNRQEFSYPIIKMDSENHLLFNFDHVETSPDTYYYTIIHCTYDWKPSNITYFEYATGFEENKIYDYETSINTLVPYTHFELKIPNEDVKLKYSGNYLLVVYTKNNENEEIACTRRFMIYEDLVGVKGEVRAGISVDDSKTSQRLLFSINKNNYNIYDHEKELKIVILQNYQWNNALQNINPSFIDNKTLVYNWDDKTQFKASNEYRAFNSINLKIESENVENIEFINPYYFITLFSDKSRNYTKYSTYTDLNGFYAIRTDRFNTKDFPDVQADYTMVKFQLENSIPLSTKDVYIYGELTNYELSDDYKMFYNLNNRSYEKLLFLKQGYYNYRYITVSKDKQIADHTFFEGSFYDTENDYLLIVYHKSYKDNYYRIINYTLFNSSK